MAIFESGTPNMPRMGETFVNSLVTTKGFILSFSDFFGHCHSFEVGVPKNQ